MNAETVLVLLMVFGWGAIASVFAAVIKRGVDVITGDHDRYNVSFSDAVANWFISGVASVALCVFAWGCV